MLSFLEKNQILRLTLNFYNISLYNGALNLIDFFKELTRGRAVW